MNLIVFSGGIIFGAAVGAAIGLWVSTRKGGGGPDVVAVDFPQVLDLLRRVHNAGAACLIMEDGTSAVSTVDPRPDPAIIDRTDAAARLAMGDGRQHVIHGDPEIVAVGDGQVGAALALAPQPAAELVTRAGADLRRLVAGARVRLVDGTMTRGDPRRAFDNALARLDSVESLSVALCESARSTANRSTAVVLRDPVTQVATVVAVSRTTDRKLIGLRVSVDSSAGRASMGDVPVVGASPAELLGITPDARRRRGDAGVAYPLYDGRQGIGALIVFGRPEYLPPEIREKVARLAAQIAPHMAAAAAVRAAETRAITDQLTGLPNRRALDLALARVDGQASLLMVDIDHFKQLNDGFGHTAGDAALKHMAQIFGRTLREGDLAARVGGEEFALLLLGAGPAVALEVAERVRRATAESRLRWAGSEVMLTCSIGVAAYPEPIRDVANLRVAADAALYRAKEAGRDRVENAAAGIGSAGGAKS
ncbi:MAG: GGDEF domain-containing protein [Gemmatimonadetes bacterium]|nr:GGDEF domain-containing protein [Gemmatimonadota bacterium]